MEAQELGPKFQIKELKLKKMDKWKTQFNRTQFYSLQPLNRRILFGQLKFFSFKNLRGYTKVISFEDR